MSSAGPERRQRAPGGFSVDQNVKRVSVRWWRSKRKQGGEEGKGEAAARPRIGRRPPAVQRRGEGCHGLQRRLGSDSFGLRMCEGVGKV